MTTLLKPKDEKKKKPVALKVYKGGREVCNFLTKEGHDIYRQRTRDMWERQGHMCCLRDHIPSCPGKLNWGETTFDHEEPRGYGGANRDDRIEVAYKQRDGTIKIRWKNGAAHLQCNVEKGSRRIDYNAAHNGDAQWDLIPKTTPSGKVFFKCSGCGEETTTPTRHHACMASTKTGA